MIYCNRSNFLLLIIFLPIATLAENENFHADTNTGARVYVDQCAPCHGNQGMGEGVLSLESGNHNDTNLLDTKGKKNHTAKEIFETITSKGVYQHFLPGRSSTEYKLTNAESRSVALFIEELRSDYHKAIVRIRKATATMEPAPHIGEKIFSVHCIICHGTSGEGDGRMQKIINTPPPSNLKVSILSEEHLLNIIRNGGTGVGRSSSMPAWGEQLTEQELKSVVIYVKSLRAQ